MLRLLLIPIILIILVWGVGLWRYVASIPFVPSASEEKTDAIITLTGGKKRIKNAVELFEKKQAPLLFISGVSPSISLDDLLTKPLTSEALKDKIILGYKATTTAENAAEVDEWVQQYSLNSIRLVTSHYHMPRSVFEIGAKSPELKIITHPVFSKTPLPSPWWSDTALLRLVLSEYHKYTVRRWQQVVGL